MKISVIIFTKNRKDDLKEALESLLKQDFNDFEVIVVNNGSTDGTIEMVANSFPEVYLISLEKNIAVKAFIEGVRHAKADIVVNLDDDSVMKKNGLKYIYEAFQRNKNLGALSANVFDYYTGKRYDPWHWFTEEEHHMDKLLPITFVNGNGSAYRKSVLEEVAYFSKSLFFYGWEMDICAKIIDAGYDVMYYPKVEILHKISKVSRNQGRSLYLMTTNGFWYYIRFFPIGIILREIPKNLVYYGAMAIRKKCFLSYLHALGSVVVGLPDVLRDRKPVKKENVARILGQYDVWKLTKLKAKEALK